MASSILGLQGEGGWFLRRITKFRFRNLRPECNFCLGHSARGHKARYEKAQGLLWESARVVAMALLAYN
jgi:hypothetical protein